MTRRDTRGHLSRIGSGIAAAAGPIDAIEEKLVEGVTDRIGSRHEIDVVRGTRPGASREKSQPPRRVPNDEGVCDNFR